MKKRADHLCELDLGENATPGEIRQAYRDLSRVWHPDRFANDPRMQAKSSDKLRRVIEAYECLKGRRHVLGQALGDIAATLQTSSL